MTNLTNFDELALAAATETTGLTPTSLFHDLTELSDRTATFTYAAYFSDDMALVELTVPFGKSGEALYEQSSSTVTLGDDVLRKTDDNIPAGDLLAA